jgi:hypothetical protein
MNVTITFQNAGPDTIWGRLAARLGREPTNAEANAEVRRILEGVTQDRAEQGKLDFQRRRRP